MDSWDPGHVRSCILMSQKHEHVQCLGHTDQVGLWWSWDKRSCGWMFNILFCVNATGPTLEILKEGNQEHSRRLAKIRLVTPYRMEELAGGYFFPGKGWVIDWRLGRRGRRTFFFKLTLIGWLFWLSPISDMNFALLRGDLGPVLPLDMLTVWNEHSNIKCSGCQTCLFKN